MTLIEHYLRDLQQIADGSRVPPEGIVLTEDEPIRRAAQLQEQIQAIGICEFVRRCAEQDGETLEQSVYDEFKPEDLMATFNALTAQTEEEQPDESAPPKIEEPDGPRNAYEVLLDCCCLDENLLYYLIDVLKRKDENEFQKLALVAARKAFTMHDFLYWYITMEQRAEEEELICVTIMDACFDRLAADGQNELIAALISGDQTTFELFRCEAPELQHLPEATFEWYDRNYLAKLYPIRYMLKFNGIVFPLEDMR